MSATSYLYVIFYKWNASYFIDSTGGDYQTVISIAKQFKDMISI